jgi:hypothetical protein
VERKTVAAIEPVGIVGNLAKLYPRGIIIHKSTG